MEPAGDPRVRQVGRVEPDDRGRHLAERDPEALAVGAEGHVVGARSDVDTMDDPLPREVDHGQVSRCPVGDVHVAIAGGDPRDFRIAEAVEDLDGPQAVPGQQRHAAGRRAEDHRGAVQRRGDHERIDEVDALQHSTAVRAERDDDHLVRGLGRDDRDRPVRGSTGRRGENEHERDGENEKSTHAIDTAQAEREVPVSYGFHAPGAWRSLVSALVWGTKGREFESRRPD